jgi:carboxylesterase
MPIRLGAEPWSHDGDSTGICLVHGFTGSPASLVPWGRKLAEQGWTVRVPRLPGHGTRWQEMNLTRWEDWYSEAFRAVDELRRRCSSVFVMGLSMGGALTLRIAENEGDAITGIVLVNPAVHSERPDRHALPLLRHIVPSFPGISNDINKPGQDEIAYDKIPLKAAHSMTRLWGAVKADIGRVRQPLLLFRSSDDHVVEPSNARWILDHVSSTDTREIVLERSAHVATLDYDAGIIEQESIDFVRRLRS